MNAEELRDYCLSLPGTREGTPFAAFSPWAERILVFYVADKVFCYFDMVAFDRCTVKCTPERIAELKERYRAAGDPLNADRKYWISVSLNDDMPDTMIKALVRDSCGLVAAGPPKPKRSGR